MTLEAEQSDALRVSEATGPESNTVEDVKNIKADEDSSPPIDVSAPSQDDASSSTPQANEAGPVTVSPPSAPKAGTAGRGRAPGAGGYVNRARHSTGGPTRAKLTPEELEAKMKRARENNAALLLRQAEVERDRDAYSELTAADRKAKEELLAKKAKEKKDQAALTEERNRNRERKLEKQERRDWDSEKAQDELWKSNYKPYGSGSDRGRGGGASTSRGGRGSGIRGGRGAPPGRRGGTEVIGKPDLKNEETFPALAPASKSTSSKPRVPVAQTEKVGKADAPPASTINAAPSVETKTS